MKTLALLAVLAASPTKHVTIKILAGAENSSFVVCGLNRDRTEMRCGDLKEFMKTYDAMKAQAEKAQEVKP